MANTLGTFLVTGHIPLVCIQIGWQAQKFCHCGLLLQWFGHCGLPLMAAPHCLWQLVVHLHSNGGQSPGRTAPMVGCKAGTFGIWDPWFCANTKRICNLQWSASGPTTGHLHGPWPSTGWSGLSLVVVLA